MHLGIAGYLVLSMRTTAINARRACACTKVTVSVENLNQLTALPVQTHLKIADDALAFDNADSAFALILTMTFALR